jgi:hypothetical protein
MKKAAQGEQAHPRTGGDMAWTGGGTIPLKPPLDDAAAGQDAGRKLILLLAVRVDVVNSLLNRRDLFGLFVRNFGFEFIFECHHELDHIERIGTEVVKEGRFVLDLGFVYAKLFSDDLLDALFDAFHADLQLGKIPANYSQTKNLLVLAMTKKRYSIPGAPAHRRRQARFGTPVDLTDFTLRLHTC